MDITCLLAAILFWLANLLKLIYLGRERSRSFNWEEYKEFDPDHIKEDWYFKIQARPHLVATAVLSMLAWLVLSFPMLQLAYALNQQRGPGTSRSVWLHIAIVVLTIGGALTEWIANFLYLGSTLSMEMLVTQFNLQTWIRGQVNDDVGLRSLELVSFALRGMVFWVDAFEWISLFFIMIFTFVAVKRYRAIDPEIFGAAWNGVGLFLGLLCLLEFVTEILRSVNWRIFSQLALWYGSLNRLILLPFWLLVLGFRLPYALQKYETKDTDYKKNDDLELDELFGEAAGEEPPVIVGGTSSLQGGEAL